MNKTISVDKIIKELERIINNYRNEIEEAKYMIKHYTKRIEEIKQLGDDDEVDNEQA